MTANLIDGAEKVIQLAGRWHPGDICFISGVTIVATSKDSSQVRISAMLQRRDRATRGWPDEDSPRFLIQIYFENAVNIELHGFGSGSKQVSGFEIESIQGAQLENIRFYIDDYEGGCISFGCSDVRIVEINQLPAPKGA